jgi:hypothetical protein
VPFIWAGGVWVTPVGPPIFGVYWLPFLLIGLFVVLLIAAGSTPERRPPAETVAREEEAALGLSAFFWVLLLVLAIAIAAGYSWDM